MLHRELGFIDPFNADDEGDSRDFKQAMETINNDVDLLNFDMENDMSDAKPAVKKTVTAKPAAPVKKTVAAKPEPTAAKPEATKKAAPAPKAAKKTGGPRGLSIPEGFVGLDKIAKDLKTEPAVLRRKLRAAEGVEKPASGVWAWKEGSKDLEKIIKLLTPKAK